MSIFAYIATRKAHTLPVEPGGQTEEPAEPAALLTLPLNQAGASMTDTVLGNTGAAQGGVETQVEGITTGSSFAVAGDGSSAGIVVPNLLAYQQRGDGSAINSFSVVVFRQRDTDPAQGNKFVLCAKDRPGMPGGWSIEEYNDAGTVKPRAYLKDSAGAALWIDDDDGDDATGVGSGIAAETAAMFALTYEAGVGAKLWSKDTSGTVTLLASQANSDAGLAANDEPIYLLRHAGGAYYDGVADDFQLYDGALDQTALEALEDPVTIDRGTPPSPNEFTCLARTSGALVETYKDLGTVTGSAAFMNMATGGAARYDFTGTVRQTPLVNPPGDLTWNGKRNLIRLDGNNGGVDHDGACVSGGAFLCPNMSADYNWNALYQSSNTPTGHVVLRETTSRNLLYEGVRIHGGWDGFQTQSGTRDTCDNITIRKWAITLGRDDAIEDDTWVPIVVDDCLIESMVAFSNNNTGFDGSGRTSTISNCLCYVLPVRIDGNPNHITGRYLKLDPRAMMLRLIGNVFAVPAYSSIDTNDNGMGPFRDLVKHGKMHGDSEGNTICWLGAGSYPFSNPDSDRFTILTGSTAADFWTDAVAAWWDSFPGHRFAFDPAAP